MHEGPEAEQTACETAKKPIQLMMEQLDKEIGAMDEQLHRLGMLLVPVMQSAKPQGDLSQKDHLQNDPNLARDLENKRQRIQSLRSRVCEFCDRLEL